MDQQMQLKQLRRDLEKLTEYTDPNGKNALQIQVRRNEGVQRIKRLNDEIHKKLDELELIIE